MKLTETGSNRQLVRKVRMGGVAGSIRNGEIAESLSCPAECSPVHLGDPVPVR